MPPQPELPELPTVAPGARRTIRVVRRLRRGRERRRVAGPTRLPGPARGRSWVRACGRWSNCPGACPSRRAALLGIGPGTLVGALVASWPGSSRGIWSGSTEVLLSAVGVGALLGAVFGALLHEGLSGGRRLLNSTTRIEAGLYDLQVDEDSADEAKRLLDAMRLERSSHEA